MVISWRQRQQAGRGMGPSAIADTLPRVIILAAIALGKLSQCWVTERQLPHSCDRSMVLIPLGPSQAIKEGFMATHTKELQTLWPLPRYWALQDTACHSGRQCEGATSSELPSQKLKSRKTEGLGKWYTAHQQNGFSRNLLKT